MNLYPYLNSISTLARPIDPRYPSNVFALGATGAVGIAVFVIDQQDGASIENSLERALMLALAAFLAWIIGRELDPDAPPSANLALLFTPFLMAGFDAEAHLIAVGLAIVISRFLSMSTGKHLLVTDALAVLILIGLTAATPYWPMSLLAVFAFYLETTLPNPDKRANIYIGAAAIATGIGFVAAWKPEIAFAVGAISWLVLFTVFGVTRLIIPDIPDRLDSYGDRTDDYLNGKRVRAAVTVLALMLLIMAWLGEGGGLIPLWAGFLGMLAWRGIGALRARQMSPI